MKQITYKILDIMISIIGVALIIGAIWFRFWLADYRIGCMFDTSPRTCANTSKISERK